jgi:hypothetical protein
MSAPRELKRRYEAFLAANDIGVDGIELVTDRAGTTYTHDVKHRTIPKPTLAPAVPAWRRRPIVSAPTSTA